MRLALQVMRNVNSVNSFEQVTEYTVQQGNPSTLYFRIIDLDQGSPEKGYQRYIPPAGATLTIKLNSLDSNRSVSRAASLPYADDRSIWSFPILSTDRLEWNGVGGVLSISGAEYVLTVITSLSSSPQGSNRFFC